MKKFILHLVGAVLILVSYTALANSSTTEEDPNSRVSQQREYLLGPGDRVNIEVYGDQDLSMKFTIGKRGGVNFPYIGFVQLTGRTTDEVELDMEARLKADYMLDPMVTVQMNSFRKFFITGEVEDPDGYEYEPQLTVEKAIALAGGFTDRADRDDINIRPSGSTELLENVNLTDAVYPGDVVIVEQSFF